MKKTGLLVLVLLLVVIAGFVWLLRGANEKNLERTEVRIDVTDQIEK